MNRDSDSGVYGSDWTQWSVEQMWHVLRNEDPERTFRHADAWYDVMQACARHRDRLRAFRDQLTHRWGGAAADVYVTRLDMLISNLDETTEAAYTTYRALHTMASAITVARDRMAPLYAQWQRLDSQEQDYQNQWWIAQVFSSNPATAEAREALNQPAREVMRVASDAIFQSYVEMTPTPQLDVPDLHGEVWDSKSPSTGVAPTLISGGALPFVPQLPSAFQPPPTGVGTGLPILTGNAGVGGSSPVSPPVSTGPTVGSAPLPPAGSINVINGPRVGPSPIQPADPQGQRGRAASRVSAAANRATSSPILPPIVSARPGTPGWTPTPSVVPPGGRQITPAGGVLRSPGTARSVRGQHDRDARGDEVFGIDTEGAVQPIIDGDPEPSFCDPGPAIGISK
jgi:hypothetical protein